MLCKWIAVGGATVLIAGLAAPATAVSQVSSNVRHLQVRKIGQACMRVNWRPPAHDNGDNYAVIIRTQRGDELHRVETYKTHVKLCNLDSRTYQVQVKQYGGTWARQAVRIG